MRNLRATGAGLAAGLLAFWTFMSVQAVTLEEVKQRGTLRHLGIPYANFVKEQGLGLDQELIQRFAEHLGVSYEWVPTTWSQAFSDLTGQNVRVHGDRVLIEGSAPVRGDLIANGLTVLPWRKELVIYSHPTFPTGVWLITRAASPLKPIKPTGEIETDIEQVMALLNGFSVLAMKGTCLDPALYELEATGADIRYFEESRGMNLMAPAMIDGAADATILDIPDALVALQRWPGEIKVIGPISQQQLMGVAFSKDSSELAREFNAYFQKIAKDGAYRKLVEKHFPTVFLYLNDFFVELERP